MEWALRTAVAGEAADKVMARAVYYADWVGEGLEAAALSTPLQGRRDPL